MEDLWDHALNVLDNQDTSDLYKYHDETGILDSHRRHFESFRNVHDKEATTKDIYFELIKMMIDKELSEKPDHKKRHEIKEVRKIQGYQDLTNKLFRRLTKQLLNNYVEVKERLEKIEGILGGGGDFNLNDRLDDIDLRLADLKKNTDDKYLNLNEETISHNIRIGSLETDVKSLDDQLKGIETMETVKDEQAKIQKDLCDALEKRIDTNEKNLDVLMDHDRKKEEELGYLREILPSLEGKVRELENADAYLRDTNQEFLKRTNDMEEDNKKARIDVKDLADAFDTYKKDKEMDDEKVRAKIEILTGEDNDIRKKVEDFIENQAEIDAKQNKDLESLENDLKTLEENLRNLRSDEIDSKEKEKSSIEELKDRVHDVGEKIRQLEGISNQNADVINQYTLTHINIKEKLEEFDSDSKESSRNLQEQIDNCKRDISDNGEEMRQLAERVKYNYERLDPLSEIPLRVQNLENASNENGNVIRSFQDMLYRIESDVNNNKERITIEVDERGASDKNLEDQINKLKHDAEVIFGKLEIADEDIKRNLEKIINLEEVNVTNQEKAVYVESLASRVSAIDEAKQQSEAKMKEELETNVRGNKEAIESLYNHFNDRLDKLQDENSKQSGDLSELKDKSKELKEELERLRDEARKLMDEDIDKLSEKVNGKLAEVDDICGKNEKHVENLRELNKKLMDDIESNKSENLKKMDEKLEDLRKEIPLIDPEDFRALVDSKFQIESKLNDLLERAKILDNEIEETKKDLVSKHEHTHTIIRETTERSESTFKQLEEKVTIIERIQSENQEELRKEVETLKDDKKKAEQELEEQIRTVGTQAQEGIENVGAQIEDKAQTIQKRYEGLRTDLDVASRDMWTIFLELYGKMRIYTVIMKSEGSAANHQSACLGVYRSIDCVNDRPVYKQEDGENYLYYSSAERAWMIASSVGNNYAWMRYPLSDDGDKSSSSSSDSDSDDDNKAEKRKKKIGKLAKKSIMTPDLFNAGWQYKMSPLMITDEAANIWMTDDATLRVEPLGGVKLTFNGVTNKPDFV